MKMSAGCVMVPKCKNCVWRYIGMDEMQGGRIVRRKACRNPKSPMICSYWEENINEQEDGT